MKRLVASIALILICLSTPVFAAEPEWAEGTSRGSAERIATNLTVTSNRLPGCTNQAIYASTYTKSLPGCVLDGDNYSLAIVYDTTETRPYQNVRRFHVRIGADQKYYPIIGFNEYDMFIIPEQSDGLIVMKWEAYSYGSFYRKYDDFIGRLSRSLISSGNTTVFAYAFNDSSPDSTVTTTDGYQFRFVTYALSHNKRYFYGEADGQGAIIVDTAKNVARKVSNNYNQRYSGATVIAAVSDTGNYVLTTGRGTHTTLFKLSGTCGTSDVSLRQYVVCPSVYLSNDVKRTINADSINNINVSHARFIDDFAIELTAANLGNLWRIKLEAGGYVPPERLEYLALGDSYSSGEGDNERQGNGMSYYYPYLRAAGDTDEPDCHVSSRSYPFILRDYYDIDPQTMKSVACSGATIVSDYTSQLSTYRGQGNRLSHLSLDRRHENQTRALKDFVPGYVPQLEFVKKYKPKFVTLTGGGNDVGFGKILRYCIGLSSLIDTCEYAKESSETHKLFLQSIDSQYGYMMKTITKIKQYSPQTTIIVVGYPSFVGNTFCTLNAGIMQPSVIRMINHGIERMNSRLEQAATDTGMRFVNVGNTLHGGRLCEGSELVTGAVAAYYEYRDVEYGSFHPNAKGHRLIANRIISQDIWYPQTDGITLPSISTIISDGFALIANFIDSTTIYLRNSQLQVKTDPGVFMPESTVKVTIRSSPVDLGEYTVDGTGSLVVNITLPDSVEAGLHLITFAGNTYSGEKITYYQFITVAASADDIDGDGVLNSEDKCNFISSWFDETTGKDICLPDKPATPRDTISSHPNSTQPNPSLVLNGVVHDQNILGEKSPSSIDTEYSPDTLSSQSNKSTSTIPTLIHDEKPVSTDRSIQDSHPDQSYQIIYLAAILIVLTGGVILYAYKINQRKED